MKLKLHVLNGLVMKLKEFEPKRHMALSIDEPGVGKEALFDRTFAEPRATYQRLGLKLRCTLELGVKASDSGSTASLWGLRLRSLARARKAWAGGSASDNIVGCGARGREYDVVRNPSRHITRPEAPSPLVSEPSITLHC
ncbi:unnamed protein product [Caenorhabditis auriculariae]|uniref:Uncharacterized protein n=1 Tax=Caenorhabditis auriculariae TaxID=2777116 RepID=A0A8S1HPQ7_9PELO|nr:unnamed protein product [Caenorhabditis auriculariae]